MKKVFTVIFAMVLSVSAFAVDTVTMGVKANGCNITPYIGCDLLVKSFDKSELWIEPRLGFIGCMVDNTDKAISHDIGLTLSNVYFATGFFLGVDTDFCYSKFNNASCYGLTIGGKIGYKANNTKLSVGIDKGFYHCSGDDIRKESDKYPAMFSIGVEMFY